MRECTDRLLDKFLREHLDPTFVWIRVSDAEEQLYYWDYIHGHFCSAELRRTPMVQSPDSQAGY